MLIEIDVLSLQTHVGSGDREPIENELKIAKGKFDDAMFDMAKQLIGSSEFPDGDTDRLREISQFLRKAVFDAIENILHSKFEQFCDLAQCPDCCEVSIAQPDVRRVRLAFRFLKPVFGSSNKKCV